MAGWLQTAVVIAVVVALHVPLGDYMARTLGSGRHWRAEMVLYRCCGIDPDAEQRWPEYLRLLLAVSVAGVLGCTCCCGPRRGCRIRWVIRA